MNWGIKLHLKPITSSVQESLLSRWPGEDFNEVGFAPGYGVEQYLGDYATCLQAITPPEKDEDGKLIKGTDGRGTSVKARAVSAAFARFLTSAMAGTWLKTPGGDLYAWQVHEAQWKVFKDATTIIEGEVRLQFGILHQRREYGKVDLHPRIRSRLAEPLDDETFLTQLAKACERRAPVTEQQLDGVHMRYKFVFSGGQVWDFRSNCLRAVRPADMLSRHAPWRFKPPTWSSETESQLKEVFESIARYFSTGDTLNDGESSEKPEVQAIIAELNRLSSNVEILKIIHNFGDWAFTVYLLCWILRAIMTHPQFTELLYFWGLGSSGKDLLMTLIIKMLGDVPGIGYAASVSGSYVTSPSGRGSEDSTPFLASWQNLKFLTFYEVPSKSVNFEVLKQLTEQQGVAIAARSHGGGSGSAGLPANWTPTLTVMMTSNHACQPIDTSDTGVERRLAMLRTQSVFRAQPNPENPYEKQLDVNVGAAVDQGKYSADLFHLAKHLLPVLSGCRGTEIKPQPASMVEERTALFKSMSSNGVREWLTSHTQPVARKDASTFEEVRDAYAIHRCDPRTASLLLEAEGVTSKDAGASAAQNGGQRRRACWKHPKCEELGILTNVAPGILLKP